MMMLSSARKIQCPALFIEFGEIGLHHYPSLAIPIKIHILNDNHASTDISSHERQEWASHKLVELVMASIDNNRPDYLDNIVVITRLYYGKTVGLHGNNQTESGHFPCNIRDWIIPRTALRLFGVIHIAHLW
jgi:hypothetical protein